MMPHQAPLPSMGKVEAPSRSWEVEKAHTAGPEPQLPKEVAP